MKPDDKSIKWAEEPKLGLAGKSYLPLIAGGITTTSEAPGESQDDRADAGGAARNGRPARLSRCAPVES